MPVLTNANGWRSFEADFLATAEELGVLQFVREENRTPWTERPDRPDYGVFVASDYLPPDTPVLATAASTRAASTQPLNQQIRLEVAQARADAARLSAESRYNNALADWQSQCTGHDGLMEWLKEHVSSANARFCAYVQRRDKHTRGAHVWYDTLADKYRSTALESADIYNYNEAVKALASVPVAEEVDSWIGQWHLAMIEAKRNGVNRAVDMKLWWSDFADAVAPMFPSWYDVFIMKYQDKITSRTLNFEDVVKDITFYIQESGRSRGRLSAVMVTANKRECGDTDDDDDEDDIDTDETGENNTDSLA